jgi:hypothetical protein
MAVGVVHQVMRQGDFMSRGRVRSLVLALGFALSTIALTASAAAAPSATSANGTLAPPTNLRVVGTTFDGWHSWPVLDWERSADDDGCCMDYYVVEFQAVDPANPFPYAGDSIPSPTYDTSRAGYGYCLEGAYEVTVRYLAPGGRSAASNKVRVDLPYWLSGSG